MAGRNLFVGLRNRLSAEAQERIEAKVTAALESKDWTVGFWVAEPFRHVEVKVQAADSREALLMAISRVTLRGHERFHCLHINTSDKYASPDCDEILYCE